MKKNALIVLLISIIMLDAGCFTFLSTFKKRQTKNLSRALASISPSDKPVHGTALVLLPSDVEILKHYLDFTMFLQVSDVEIQKNCISYVPDPQLWEMRIPHSQKARTRPRLRQVHSRFLGARACRSTEQSLLRGSS